MSNKRYRLKKDLPDLMATPEVIFQRVGDITMPTNRDYSYSTPARRYWYSRAVVENSPDWFEEIKEPSHTQQGPKRDWEVLKIKTHQYLELNKGEGHFDDFIRTNSCDIISVRRLSDGEVFTVGDNTNHGKIIAFQLSKGEVYLQLEERGNFCDFIHITNIKKLPPKPQVLFTTNDGVGIFPGDTYWHIISDWTAQMENAVEAGREQYKNRTMQTFSTKEKADEWVLMNKPCLSVNDFAGLFKSGNVFESPLIRDIKKLAQQKQPTT